MGNMTHVLNYNNTEIRAAGERLNMTDMWKAAGADPSRKPAEWLRSADAVRFIEFLAETMGIEVGNSQLQLVKVSKGGRGIGGSTAAHWQIGLAYAKYLSPEFHMWCNTVVRERMEGRGVAVPEVGELARRTDGIVRTTIHKVTGIERAVEGIGTVMRLMSDAVTDQDSRIGQIERALLDTADIVKTLVVANDPRVAALSRVSQKELLEKAKVPSKGRSSINRRFAYHLPRYAISNGVLPDRCPHSGTLLYPRDLADRFMKEKGSGWVRDHMAKVFGQGVLQFPDRRSGPPQPEGVGEGLST
ncbi:MAG: hypothetical protein VR70_05805 [Rhodospirillaceae bacterium BRH_c57]|nr:MAG: hypothetical protein VR70_05805 [Rhodospirillaceae bacterium BRH_c57]